MPVRNAKTAKTTWLETTSMKDFEAALETNRLTFIRGYKLKGASIQGELPPAGSQGQLIGAVECVVDSVGLVNEFNG
jgi:hypothetical protein